MPRRVHRHPTLPVSDWLQRLHDALFAAIPVEEPDWTWEGREYLCQRQLEDMGARLLFREVWLDPDTYELAREWTLDLDAGSWVGPIPAGVYQQQLRLVVDAIDRMRPRQMVRTRLPLFQPERFAQDPARRRPWS